MDNSRFNFRDCLRCCGAAAEAVTEPCGDGAGHEEEHGPGEEEAVSDPFAVEEGGTLGVEGAEEALESAWRVAGVEDTGVAGLPGDEAEEEGEGDGEPGPEDGWGVAGAVGFGGESGGG